MIPSQLDLRGGLLPANPEERDHQAEDRRGRADVNPRRVVRHERAGDVARPLEGPYGAHKKDDDPENHDEQPHCGLNRETGHKAHEISSTNYVWRQFDARRGPRMVVENTSLMKWYPLLLPMLTILFVVSLARLLSAH